jgi:SET and MYND domain-containing protein
MLTSVICAGCQKEPRSVNGIIVPLQRCSRCKKAFYHDRICQAKHYKQHRAACTLASNSSGNKAPKVAQILLQGDHKDKPQNQSKAIGEGNRSFYSIQHIYGKGKSLIANIALDAGCFIPSNQAEGILPLVHPVLFQSCRRSHCAWCFEELSSSTKQILFDHSVASYIVCSPTCREQVSAVLKDEIQALKFLYPLTGQTLGPPILLPTALLVFRMMHSVQKGIVDEAVMEAMISHKIPLSEDATIHQEATVISVKSLLRTSSLLDVENDTIIRLLGYAKYNSFTITLTGASLGVGLFRDPAHFVNHSCRPNAMQLFQIRTGSAPMLRLVMTHGVKTGEEICISYNSEKMNAPSKERQDDLFQNYNFRCNCEMCREDNWFRRSVYYAKLR